MHSLVTAPVRRLAALLVVALCALLGASAMPSAGAAAANGDLHEWTLTNPALPDGVGPLGQGRVAEANGRSFLLYSARYTHAPWVLVHDRADGASSHVALPAGTTGGTAWARADVAVAGENLWVLSGAGPIHLRHYRLSGSPLPTSATLVSERTLGDVDSRAGALTRLASGAVAGVWHQQGATTPQRLQVVHATPAGSVTTTTASGMSTRSSTQAVVQHPADGSVWVFSSADAGGAIAGVRLVEGPTGLSVDRIDIELITRARHGALGPDPEAPDLEAAPDPLTGSIAVAYQSSERRIFSTQPFVAGSHLAVARVGADAALSFTVLPVYVERISAIGLTVDGPSTWLAYRPVNSDLSFDTLHVSRHDGTAWDSGRVVGRLGDPRAMVYFGRNHVSIGGPMLDNSVRLLTEAPAPTERTTSSSDGGGSDDTEGGTNSTTRKGKGGGGGGGGGKGGPKR